jgi:hypothetical protein
MSPPIFEVESTEFETSSLTNSSMLPFYVVVSISAIYSAPEFIPQPPDLHSWQIDLV